MAHSLKIVSGRSEEEEEEKSLSLDKEVCSICLSQFAKYTCPRCNVRYCSLTCYRSEKHSRCSESFYKECVTTELRQQRGSEDDRRKVAEMLVKLQRGEEVGEGGGEEGSVGTSMEERMAGLNLDRDTEAVWQRLTSQEKREFNQMLGSGKMERLLPAHTPWWEVSRLVVDADSSEGTPHVPGELANLPPLSTLIKDGKASPSVRHSVLNVLYAYAYIVRLFRGEQSELPLQACEAILSISSILSADSSFLSTGEALKHAMATVQQHPDLFNSPSFSLSVLKDVGQLLCQRRSRDCHVTHALSDLHMLLGQGRRQTKAAKGDGCLATGEERGRKRLWLAQKKVVFLAAWSKENRQELSLLAQAVDIEHDTAERELQREGEGHMSGMGNGENDYRVRKQPVGKLIEEIH